MADQHHYYSMPLVVPIPTNSVPNTPSPAADSPPATMPQTEINSNNSSGSGSSSKDQINGMAILVAFVVMLSLATLLLTFCICVTLRRSRRGRAGVFSIRSWPPAFISGAFAGSRSDSSSAPSGLDPAAIRRLPITVIAAKTESASAAAAAAAEVTVTVTECSVCISEFRAGDKARALPACGHMFHLDCIDTWLLSHSTCPLCRTSVVVPVASPPPPPAATLSAAELTASTSVSSSSRSKGPSVGGSADAAIDIGDDFAGVLSREGEETRPSGRRGVARILSRGRDGGSGRVHPQPDVPAHDSSTSSA